jgi:hypothetical protein
MNLNYQRFKNWPIWCAIFLLIIIVGYRIEYYLPSTSLIYWVRIFRSNSNTWVLFFNFAFCVILLPWMYYEARQFHNYVPLRSMIGLTLFIGEFVLCVVLGFTYNESYIHQTTVGFNAHVYHLSWQKNVSGYGSYIVNYLYECDSIGLVCHLVHEQHDPIPLPIRSVDNIVNDAKLISDPILNTLTLETNGKIVYTHQP